MVGYRRTMADRTRGDGWWQASDDKWYPPELLDAPRPQWQTTDLVPIVVAPSAATVSAPNAAIAWMLATSAASVLTALGALNLASVIRSSPDPVIVDNAFTHVGETGVVVLALLALSVGSLVSGILFIIWLFKASNAMDRRGPIGRSWSSGWAIGGWFIPLASLVIPKLVFAELERIAQVPYGGVPIGERWKPYPRSGISDLWWLMWVSASVVGFVGYWIGTLPEVENEPVAWALTIWAISLLMTAGAGVALVVTLRSFVRAANQ